MRIRHSEGGYEVDFVSTIGALFAQIPDGAVFITDQNVGSHYLRERDPLLVPPGERSKSVEAWSGLQSELTRRGANRRTPIVAFGGGVVGDLAGFVAATYMRGVPFIQVPTSLLAMVDSSVGGKVGIDLPEGKNLVGAFYPPERVLIAPETLQTLPAPEFVNGMAEVWKYAFILDPELGRRLAAREAPQALEPALIERCVDLKRQVVEADEFETKGERAKLNFGHTVGHALEKVANYEGIRHGEAISVGMVVECKLAERLGLAQAGLASRVEQCLQAEGLPTASVRLRNVEALVRAMRTDKKASEGRLAFSLVLREGECILVDDVPESDVRTVLEAS